MTPKLWKISDNIPRARVSFMYRIGTLMAAAGMVLLPLIYIGLIFPLAWGLWSYAKHGTEVREVHRGQSSRNADGMTWIAMAIGGVVILFMIKPLFSRRPKSVEPRRLRREDEPQLFAFIDEISDLVGSPRPKRVQVDLQVNASAALTHGFWSLFTRNLTLTIGLPLAGGLSARELGGVLAHEFGHFAQGAGMMTTYVVRVVSFWFARVVYERDRLDTTLEEWAKGGDIRVMIVLQIARFFVWLVRRVLWVLMMIGQVISAVLMRQMEFDADHYEIQTDGTAGFIATSRKLRILNVGSQVANNRMAESFQSRRLVDNLPGYMTLEAEELTEDSRSEIAEAALKEKTGWLDSHPSDSERVAAAEKAAASGVLESDAAGTALFTDFVSLSKEVTQTFYRDVLQLPVKNIALLPLEAMAEESHGSKRGDAAMDAYFHDMLTPFTMLYLTPEDLAPEAPNLPARNKAARFQPDDLTKAQVKELNEAISRDRTIRAASALTTAKIPIKNAAELKLESVKPDYLTQQGIEVKNKLKAIASSLTPPVAQSRERLATALSYLLSLTDTPPDLNKEVRRYISVLRSMQGFDSTLRALRAQSLAVGPVLNSMNASSNQNAVFAVASAASDSLKPLIELILSATHEVAYPFAHAGGIVNLAAYLTTDVDHPDPIIFTFLRGEAVLSRAYSIYGRIMGRLAILAMEAERKMDDPTTENANGSGASKISNLEA